MNCSANVFFWLRSPGQPTMRMPKNLRISRCSFSWGRRLQNRFTKNTAVHSLLSQLQKAAAKVYACYAAQFYERITPSALDESIFNIILWLSVQKPVNTYLVSFWNSCNSKHNQLDEANLRSSSAERRTTLQFEFLVSMIFIFGLIF